MINRIFKITIKRKNMRRFIRRFVRARYESVSEGRLDIKLAVAHKLLSRFLYRNFNARRKIFDAIQIQTNVGCNYSCPFCPANKPGLNLYGGAPNGAKMDLALFKHIIAQLSELRFSGGITPFLMNEPLLDKGLPELIYIIREKCPQAFLFIQTNGSLLDENLARELIKAGIDEIYVNDYREDDLIEDRIANMSLGKKYRIHITLEKRSFNEKLSNRAGNAYSSSIFKEPLRIPCIKPFNQMYITYNGLAILCDQDWQFEQVMGDAKSETLLDIWANEKYEKYRANLRNHNRANNYLCAKCDYGGLW